jgi:hypothetical protein
MNLIGMVGSLLGMGKNAGKSGGGIGSLLTGGLGTLMKGGGLLGVLVMLFKMIVDTAKNTSSDDEWHKISSPLRGSFDNLFKSLGFEMPDMVKSALSLFEDRGKAATLSSADQKNIATGIAEATPTEAHPQLAVVAQEQIVRLESLPTLMPEVAPVDKFGFDPKLKQTSPPPSLEQLDQLEHVNTVGIADLKRTAEKLATSKNAPDCEPDKLQGTINEMLVSSLTKQYGAEAVAQISKTRPPACR